MIILLVSSVINAQLLDTTVATVKLTKLQNISKKALQEKIVLLEERITRSLNEEEIQAILKGEINSILLQQAAERDSVSITREDLDRAIELQKARLGVLMLPDRDFRLLIERQTGFSYAEYEKNLRDTLIARNYLMKIDPKLADENNFRPTDVEIVKFYEENAVRYATPSLVRFSHLFVSTANVNEAEILSGRKKIDELRRRISTGQATFESLFEESLDDPSYLARDFGFFARGDEELKKNLGANFVDVVSGLDEDEVSGVLESSLGIHIVKITDKRQPRLLKLGDPLFPGDSMTVQTHISQVLSMENQGRMFNEVMEFQIEKLRENAEIRIFSQNLNFD